jgi:hypothetical protein
MSIYGKYNIQNGKQYNNVAFEALAAVTASSYIFWD